MKRFICFVVAVVAIVSCLGGEPICAETPPTQTPYSHYQMPYYISLRWLVYAMIICLPLSPLLESPSDFSSVMENVL